MVGADADFSWDRGDFGSYVLSLESLGTTSFYVYTSATGFRCTDLPTTLRLAPGAQYRCTIGGISRGSLDEMAGVDFAPQRALAATETSVSRPIRVTTATP
jgi:hypothetical protein